MTKISEPNTLLEINESHADNFILVIPRLPTAQFLGSAFAAFNSPATLSPPPSSTDSDCDTDQSSTIRREHNLDLTNFKLYVSDVTMPGITITKNEVATQFATMSRASKISFTDLSTTMKISENFLNYNIILFWLYALHNPEEYNKMSGREMINNFFTDIYLIITNNHREKVIEYKFMDAFPTSLPNIPLTVKTADNLNAEVTWAHSGMTPTNNFVLKFV